MPVILVAFRQIATDMYWDRRLRAPASTDTCQTPSATTLGVFACSAPEEARSCTASSSAISNTLVITSG